MQRLATSVFVVGAVVLCPSVFITDRNESGNSCKNHDPHYCWTLRIPDTWAHYLTFSSAFILLFIIFTFYTIPLQAATSLLNPQALNQVFPGYAAWLESIPWFKDNYSGLVSGLIFSFFFSLCPAMFKFIANFGSNATSHFHAEYTAMKVCGNTCNIMLFLVVAILSSNCPSRSTSGGFMWLPPSGEILWVRLSSRESPNFRSRMKHFRLSVKLRIQFRRISARHGWIG